ncbi:hypothetical protein [Streptococcus pyogenes]|uniref:hypothetical protein n=1 Tax=Streptococcus pyogenes TaxID=1314 RepID=UPI0010F3C638|nr:hypothetical protein [Streptococcus pyogenes]VHB38648.1 phage protein [Streptococcus pyogenes]VHB89726.1 phage protein [Streptococcus pyogenes]VHG44218.1 phage protein [Streptococcus pyogenes]VHM61398.1 phage protein [Streptococcus pyogenes]
MNEIENKLEELEEMVINMDEVDVVIPWKIAKKPATKSRLLIRRETSPTKLETRKIKICRQTFRKSPQFARGT